MIKGEEDEPLKPNTAHGRHSKVSEVCFFGTWYILVSMLTGTFFIC